MLNARRLVMQDLQDREVVTKLFDTIAPRFAARPGGYTRLLRLGFRKGDSAEVAQVELVGSEFDPAPRPTPPRREGSRKPRVSADGCARRRSGCAARRKRPEAGGGKNGRPSRPRAPAPAGGRRRRGRPEAVRN